VFCFSHLSLGFAKARVLASATVVHGSKIPAEKFIRFRYLGEDLLLLITARNVESVLSIPHLLLELEGRITVSILRIYSSRLIARART
jgi:hypothetical protein